MRIAISSLIKSPSETLLIIKGTSGTLAPAEVMKKNTCTISYLQFIFILCTCLLAFSCQGLVDSIEPQFTVSQEDAVREVNTIIKLEDIHIEGHTMHIDDHSYPTMFVQLINPQDIPEDSLEAFSIQKKVAAKLKSSLKNSSQFTVYYIVFLQKYSEKVLMFDVKTKNGFYPNNFNAENLDN